MSDSVQIFFAYLTQGLRDSILGAFKVYKIHQEQKAHQAVELKVKEESQYISALARRRADRSIKQKEIKTVKQTSIIERILLCCALNGGVFMLSIFLFDVFFLQTLHFVTQFIFDGSETHSIVWSWISSILSWTFNALWILPLFVLSKIINSLWFQDIADAAYKRTRGRPQLIPSFGRIIADILFSLLLQSLFLIQGMLASFLPIPAIGNIISMLHMCLLYSLYAFEYKWFNMGWEVNKRLAFIECNWPYFAGFGLPLALLTYMISSFVLSGCVFAILFPLFIIGGNEADLNPLHYDYPFRIFSPVISLSDGIFRIFINKSKSSSSNKNLSSDGTGTSTTFATS